MKTNMNGYRLTASSILAIAAASAASMSPVATFAQEAESAAEAHDSDPMHTIMVTARKREESLLEVPLAITAISSEDLNARGISSVNDIVDYTPGINVSNVNSGRNDRSFQQISMRGFTPSTATSTLTASFIDGVPVASATALNAVVDPARVEVLKGPQNAYFGRNAFAGAINIVTKDPKDTFGASISAEWQERNGYDLAASVEGPIVDGLLSFRATGRMFGQDGAYTNSFNQNQTLGDQSTKTATLQFNLTPSPDVTIKAFGMYSADDDGPSADGMVSAYELRSNNGTINIPALSGSTAGNVIVPGQSTCTIAGLASGISATEATVNRPYFCGAIPKLAFGPGANTTEDPLLAKSVNNGQYRVVSPGKGVQGYGLVREYVHVHLAMDWDIADTGLTLSSLSGFNDEYYSQIDDLDNYDSSSLNGSGIPGARGYWNFPFMVERGTRDYSQELRLSYDNSDQLQAMIGVSYLKVSSPSDLVNVYSEEQFLAPRAASSVSPTGKSKTWGVFGSLTYDFTDALSMSLEGRYQWDTISSVINPGMTGEYSVSQDYGNFMPRAIVNYNITPDVMVYASFSQAVNVSISSFNTRFLVGTPEEKAAAESLGLETVLDPERLDNYEIGLKGEFLNGRLRATLAAYHAVWKDQYNNRSVIIVDSANVPQIISGVANAGRTKLDGIELDLWAEPVDGLTLTFAGAMNDSSIQTFSDPSISKQSGLIGDDFKGKQLPLSSKFSATAGIQYSGEISSWDDGSYFVRADFAWKDKQYLDASNLYWIKDRETVALRAGIKRDGYSLEAFVTNLFDNDDYVSGAQNSLLEPSFRLSSRGFGYVALALPNPRTVGVKASYSF